ncbi:MAG TPA: SGNH/GDSL hydrolase family protein [Solirubrobacteraceae bacterium]|nr:SGNH/GDSL hydrolase family protein [Solirubrobacteraceae bacterium]
MDTRRFRLALAGAAVAAACAAVPASAGATNYVAMGDSYTSGPGIEPYSPTNPAACGVSERSYPYLVAQALNLSLTDVSCGGAKTSDETESQLEGQPPQDEALSASTEVVTLGMGGNDHNLFGTLVEGCTILDYYIKPSNKSPCKDNYEGFVTKTFAEDKPEQEAALRHIKELAPNAKVFVIGYPEIIDRPCPNFPWYEKDALWFRNKVQKVGDKLIEEGAKANGAIFVNTFKPSEGHNACQEVGTRWIEPLFNSLTGVAVHPNALGQQQDSYDIELAMLRAGIR